MPRRSEVLLLLYLTFSRIIHLPMSRISSGVPHHPVLLAVASGRCLYAEYHSEVRSGGIELVPAATDGWSERSAAPPPTGESSQEAHRQLLGDALSVVRSRGQ